MSDLTREKFLELNIDNLILNAEEKSYRGYEKIFCEYYKNTNNEIYKFLASICSINMVIEDNKVIYKPQYVSYDATTLTVEAIEDKELEFLDNILNDIEDYLLKARISDFLFYRKKHNQYAECSIENFLKVKLENNQLSILIWNRIIDIINHSKLCKNEYLDNIKEIIYSEIENYNFSENNKFYLSKLYEIAKKIGIYKEDFILLKFEAIFDYIKNNTSDYFLIHSYSNILLDIVEDTNKKNSIYNDVARYFLNIKCSGIQRASLIEQAINMFYNIPKDNREKFIKDKELEELIIEKRMCNKDFISKMHFYKITIKYPNEILIKFENDIKSFNDNIRSLEYLFNNTRCSINKIMQDMENIIKNPSFIDFLAVRYSFDDDRSRKIKTPNFYSDKKEDRDKFNILKKRETYSFYLQMSSINILYLKRLLKIYCNIDYNLIESICAYSGLINLNKVNLFSKAIFMCYEDDYVSGLSILIPQIEDWIRYILNLGGINTRNRDRKNNFDQELSLDQLLSNKKEDLIKIFGEELYFEINTLFSNEDLCFNLRNRLSHGLINYETFYSYPYIYSWLLIFNIIFINFLHNTKNN